MNTAKKTGVLAALTLTGLAVTAYQIRRRLVVVTVSGLSMQPTLQPGDRVLVHRTNRPTRGQIVVFTHRSAAAASEPGARLIKRVVAVAGDPLPATVHEAEERAIGASEVVPNGTIIVLGDNPRHSYDSREFGPIPTHQIVGTIVRAMANKEGTSTRTAASRAERGDWSPSEASPEDRRPRH